MKNAKRSRHLLESGQQKFKTFANRILKESEPGTNNRTPEDLLNTISQPPLPNFDLCQHLEKLAELSTDDEEVFLVKTGEELRKAAEAWLNDRDVASMSESELKWRQILSQTVSEYENHKAESVSANLSFSGLMSHSDETLVDLLFQPTLEVDELYKIRVASRAETVSSNGELASMHRTIYVLVHASDIIHHKVCTSKNNQEAIQANIDSSLSEEWLDEQSRWQLNEAAKILTNFEVVFRRPK